MDINTLIANANKEIITLETAHKEMAKYLSDPNLSAYDKAGAEQVLDLVNKNKTRVLGQVEKLENIKAHEIEKKARIAKWNADAEKRWKLLRPEERPVPKEMPKEVPKEAVNIAHVVTAAVITSIILATLAVSILIYKRYLSKGAKACAGRKGVEKGNCLKRFKITGYEQSIKMLRGRIGICSKSKKPNVCKAKLQSKIVKYQTKVVKAKRALKESVETPIILESYLNYLYGDESFIEKDIRGANLPVEGDNKPNWIRECMMLEDDREKINCLRRLREMTAMNPFYQYRIDRFVDAITQNYDASGNNGMVPEVEG